MASHPARTASASSPRPITAVALRTRAKAARSRSRRAAARQDALVQHIAQALDDHALAEQPFIPPWLSVLLSGLLVGLLYLAWHAPG